MTSLRGPGERNFNAVSHKPTRAPIQFNSICSRQLWFMGYGIKISFPRPPQWRHRSPGRREHETKKHVLIGASRHDAFCRQTFQVWQTLKQTVAPKLSCLYVFPLAFHFFSTLRHVYFSLTNSTLDFRNYSLRLKILAKNILSSESKSSRQQQSTPNFKCLAAKHVMFAPN